MAVSTADTGSLLAALIAALVLIAIIVWLVEALRRSRKAAGPYAYGLDFSWGRPSIQSILDGGFSFVVRYHSWDQGSGKNLTPAEAKSYLDAGIMVVSNWEYDAQAPLDGWERGYADALEGFWQRDHCGGGLQDPVLFSVDWDVQPHEYPAVADYFRGIIQAARDYHGRTDVLSVVGGYGGKYVITRLLDDGLIGVAWQTYAWSGGQWDKRAVLRQVLNGQTVGGAAVDFNEAWSANYGAWGQNEPTPSTGDGAVILNCPYDPQRVDMFYVGSTGEVWHRWYPQGRMQAMWTGQGGVENLGGFVAPGTLSATWTATGDAIDIIGLGSPDGIEPPVGCGQYWGFTLAASGARSGWGSLPDTWGMYPASAPPSTMAVQSVRHLVPWLLLALIAILGVQIFALTWALMR